MKKDISNEKNVAPSPKKKKTDKKKGIVFVILYGFICFLTVAFFSLSIWYRATFDVRFNDFLVTLLSPLSGTDMSVVIDVLKFGVLPALLSLILYGLFIYFTRSDRSVHRLLRRIGAVVVLISFVISLVCGFFVLGIPEYLKTYGEKTTIYEERYIDPNSVAITDIDGNARNLIYIYLESMETTYASIEDGGAQYTLNYMYHLTEMAKEHISFSDGEGLGGFHSVAGTGWTMGSLLGTTSGVPFSLEVFGEKSHNSQGKDGTFLNGLTTLGDILKDKGYRNSFLIGSDRAFAGTDTYLTIHGNYEMFDIHSAREQGYVPKDYHNGFWGFEDKYLYEIAKDRLTELAAGDEPFNFTMMTIDTHHKDGYMCSRCGTEFSVQTANVVACADRQIYEFIQWCKQQDFYENTTIIITGDHPRMDTPLVKGTPYYERTIYNCFINAAVESPVFYQNRVFTSLDMFPTTLVAMGFEIEGDRLGLGTNLFSTLPTHCEDMGPGKEGYDLFETELKKESIYYRKNFLTKVNKFILSNG